VKNKEKYNLKIENELKDVQNFFRVYIEFKIIKFNFNAVFYFLIIFFLSLIKIFNKVQFLILNFLVSLGFLR